MRIYSDHYYKLVSRPCVEWSNHSNDEGNCSGEHGTAFAFEQAITLVEMSEYDPYSDRRPGYFRRDTGELERELAIEGEMKANGTWVEPPGEGGAGRTPMQGPDGVLGHLSCTHKGCSSLTAKRPPTDVDKSFPPTRLSCAAGAHGSGNIRPVT